ncbi:MAG: histidinol-phosphatase [Coriobacteriaceae bacterium]|nr:histidinol-phosphatase [Coriobacteriaceae bacterium]
MIDCHVHTSRCRHAEGQPADYVAAAAARGIEVLTFTDHLPLPEGFSAEYAMPRDELPAYIEEILEAGAARMDGPEVLLGVEADWLPEHTAHVRELTAAYPFDVVMGSVHFIDDWAFDDPALVGRYDEWDADALWERYFAELERASASGLFDVMSHPDLVKKFRCAPAADPRALYEAAAHAMTHGDVAVEVSTAGLRKPCAEIYPARDFLAELRRADVPVTFGSDAHRPEDVGYGWAEARELLRETGYQSVVVFRSRLPEERGLS